MTSPRMTVPTALILHAIADGARYGFDVMDATGLPSGTVYPALRRLESRDALRSRWEKAEVALQAGRPRRRVYEITPVGKALLPAALTKLEGLPGLSGARVLRPADG